MNNVISMLKITTLLILTLLFSPSILASQIAVKGTIEVQDASHEFLGSEVTENGWTYQEGNSVNEASYEIDLTIDEADLPINVKIGPSARFSINKQGLVYLGISAGDSDAAAESQLQLPLNDQGRLVETPLLTLTTRGGDYASSQWSINAKVSIVVKE